MLLQRVAGVGARPFADYPPLAVPDHRLYLCSGFNLIECGGL